MPHYRMVVNHVFDTALPRDRILNVLHFNDKGLGSDPHQLCVDIAAAFISKWYADTISVKVECTAYDEGDPPPSPPVAYAAANPTAGPAISGQPRDLCLCLSFYGSENVPRKRGRIYLPVGREGAIGAQPSGTIMSKALALGQAMSAIGGADVDWEVWSPTTNSGSQIKNLWVDNEWDTQRRRGLKPTTRVTASTSG